MAEVYGAKPKIFTKAWWPYFWMYYKIHTIVIAFVSILIIIGLVEGAKRVSPDLGIVYYSSINCDSEIWNKAVQSLTPELNDINNDDKLHMSFLPIQIINKEQYIENNYAANIKMATSFSDKHNYIYILDKANVEANISIENKSIPFCETNKWVHSDTLKNDEICGKDKKAYAVSLANSSILKNIGIDTTDLYLSIKNDVDSPYKDEKAFENAVIIANKLLE